MNSNIGEFIRELKDPFIKIYRGITFEEPNKITIEGVINIYMRSLDMKEFEIKDDKATLTPSELLKEADEVASKILKFRKEMEAKS